MNSKSLRALVALVGVLGVIGLLASNSGFAGQTLANWNDRVSGSAKFDVPGAYGKGYARAVAAKYSMSRPVGSSVRSGLATTREPGQAPAYADVRFGNQNSVGGTLGLLLPVEIEGASCAVYASLVTVPCTNGQSTGSSVVFAAAAARGLLVETTSGGIDSRDSARRTWFRQLHLVRSGVHRWQAESTRSSAVSCWPEWEIPKSFPFRPIQARTTPNPPVRPEAASATTTMRS
ncbi:hypothetical protein NJ76_26775 [Rhodococcus sp. IITR03]|nr:hypothetical protein NJ76_26775 [Rhodococcus sp. IITR03]